MVLIPALGGLEGIWALRRLQVLDLAAYLASLRHDLLYVVLAHDACIIRLSSRRQLLRLRLQLSLLVGALVFAQIALWAVEILTRCAFL